MSEGNETGLSAEISARGTNTPGAGAAPVSDRWAWRAVGAVESPEILSPMSLETLLPTATAEASNSNGRAIITHLFRNLLCIACDPEAQIVARFIAEITVGKA